MTDVIGLFFFFWTGEIFLQGLDEAVSDPSRTMITREKGVELCTTGMLIFDRQIAEEKNMKPPIKRIFPQPRGQSGGFLPLGTCVVSNSSILTSSKVRGGITHQYLPAYSKVYTYISLHYSMYIDLFSGINLKVLPGTGSTDPHRSEGHQRKNQIQLQN